MTMTKNGKEGSKKKKQKSTNILFYLFVFFKGFKGWLFILKKVGRVQADGMTEKKKEKKNILEVW